MGATATGTVLWPDATTYPNTNVYPGQGTQPFVRCRLSFSDVSDATPEWTEVDNSDFRAFSISRGRENELSEHDAGTASVTLDNRDRVFDPTLHTTTVTPMNRIWIYEEFSSEVHSLFTGYVESWNQQWPGGGWSDAVAEIVATDEFKVLNLLHLPTTSPPRDSYESLVGSDAPIGYWRLNAPVEVLVQPPSEEEPNPPPEGGGWNRWRGGGSPGPQW